MYSLVAFFFIFHNIALFTITDNLQNVQYHPNTIYSYNTKNNVPFNNTNWLVLYLSHAPGYLDMNLFRKGHFLKWFYRRIEPLPTAHKANRIQDQSGMGTLHVFQQSLNLLHVVFLSQILLIHSNNHVTYLLDNFNFLLHHD